MPQSACCIVAPRPEFTYAIYMIPRGLHAYPVRASIDGKKREYVKVAREFRKCRGNPALPAHACGPGNTPATHLVLFEYQRKRARVARAGWVSKGKGAVIVEDERVGITVLYIYRLGRGGESGRGRACGNFAIVFKRRSVYAAVLHIHAGARNPNHHCIV